VRLQRFSVTDRPLGVPPTVIVPGRISMRKGIEDVVGVARVLRARGAEVRMRIVGGPSMWSDYRKLLDDLPPENSEYVEKVPPAQMPAEYAKGDLMLQASKYEPCSMAVVESLVSGVPVIATSEVGAIEEISRDVAIEVAPGDVEGMADAIEEMLRRLAADAPSLRRAARADAERHFAPEIVCEQLSRALEHVVAERRGVPARAAA